jgi:hypothetical protein
VNCLIYDNPTDLSQIRQSPFSLIADSIATAATTIAAPPPSPGQSKNLSVRC